MKSQKLVMNLVIIGLIILILRQVMGRGKSYLASKDGPMPLWSAPPPKPVLTSIYNSVIAILTKPPVKK